VRFCVSECCEWSCLCVRTSALIYCYVVMQVIRWFWLAVEAMTTEERIRLLQFTTGCSRVPAQGFKALQSHDGHYRKFNIQSIKKTVSMLMPEVFICNYISSLLYCVQQESLYPRAHTCFNKLDLPVYDSQAELDAYLSVVINMEITGFSME
jgi:E3 ubiquitin ligase SMURF1/2